MQIGVVTPRMHLSALGGAELHAWWLSQRLRQTGHDVEVFTTRALSHETWANVLPPGAEVLDGIPVHRFDAERHDQRARDELDRRLHAGEALSLEESERWLRGGVSAPAMERALAERKDLDVVIGMPYLTGTTYFAFRAVPDRFCAIPCLHDEPAARLATTREMLRGARGLLFNAVPEMELARSLVPDLAPSALVGLGFDEPPPGDPERFRREYGVEGPFAVCMGRLESAKGVPVLIDHMLRYGRRRPGALSLLLVGDGPIEVPSGGPVRKLKIDWAHRDDMLAASSLLIQPSRLESLSIVMMQAWLMGRPVLVDAGGPVPVHHCIASNGGLWYASYLEFEAMLDRLLADGPLADRLGASGRAYVLREYGWPAVLHRLEEALASWTMASASSAARLASVTPSPT